MVSPVRFPRDAYAPRGIDGQRLLRRGTGERLRSGGLGLPGESCAGATTLRADSARSGRNRRPSPAVISSGSSVWLPGRLRPSSRHGSLSEADASSESLLRRLSRDPAEPRLADPPASLPSLRSGNEEKRKTGRADVGLPGVSPGRTPVSLRSDSPVTLTRPGGIVGRSQPLDL